MTGAGLLRNRLARRTVLFLAILGMLFVLWRQGTHRYFSGYGAVGTGDFVAYWAAARLLMQGSNPYDPTALLAVEQAAGLSAPAPIRVWNPPWTLVLMFPLAVLPFQAAALVWLLVQVALILGSGILLWKFYAPGKGRTWIGAVVAGGFVPGWYSLGAGQISAWLLVGVVVFLYFQRRQRDWAAGSALALLMIKPHVTYLFWPAALWWAWRERRWPVLAGWSAALAAASTVVILFFPGVWSQYPAVAPDAPLNWATPTLGSLLRLAFGIERHWLQFLPSFVCGLLWLSWLWVRRGPWQWEKVAAPLLLASVPTAVYGWSYDSLVLLVPVVDLVNRARQALPWQRTVMLVAIGTLQIALVVQNLSQPNDFLKAWHPLALAGLYWWAARHDSRQAQRAVEDKTDE
jgi:hypothetical protein